MTQVCNGYPVSAVPGVDCLDGAEWVMVDQHKDKVADTDDTEARIDLKKRVWQMRVCQRKTAARIATQLEDEGIDAATVEAFAGEVETLRARHGLHWTWFEQELLAGHFDLELRGKSQDSLHNVLLPPSMSDSTAFPSLGGGSVTTAIGSKCTQRASPTSSARSTPKLRPKASPLDSPEVHKKQMPPVEVWLAAEKHRKSNFFGAAVFGKSAGSKACLYEILASTEVQEALDLGMTSRAFATALLEFRNHDFVEVESFDAQVTEPRCVSMSFGSASALWRLLGTRAAVQSQGTRCDVSSGVPFESDPDFRMHLWARQQSFTARLRNGSGSLAIIVPVASELGGPGTKLGPFLPAHDTRSPHAVGALLDTDVVDDCSRLVVSDGRQTMQVVDVGRRRGDEVEVDRYGSKRTIFSSLGTHPAEVTSSWPSRESGCCVAAGGLIAANPLTAKGNLAKDAANAAAFQWLELPDFDFVGPRSQEHVVVCSKQQSPSNSPPSKPHASPTTQPLQANKLCSPTMKHASPTMNAKRSPTLKAKETPPNKSHIESAPPPLLRVSVSQEQVGSVIGLKSNVQVSSLVVEATWPLPGNSVALMVRGCNACNLTQSANHQLSAQQASSTTENPFWLQVWEIPSVADTSHKVGTVPVATECLDLRCPVTCLDAISSTHIHPGLILLGHSSGYIELRHLPRQSTPSRPATLLLNATLEVGSSIVQVLLRPGDSADKVVLVVAQAERLSVAEADVRETGSARKVVLQRLLPCEAPHHRFHFKSMQAVGDRGFAVCGTSHVYAFEARGALPVITAIVELPAAPVLQFAATPYDFMAVLDSNCCEEKGISDNLVCCLWPSTASAKAQAADGQPANSLALKAWVNGRPNVDSKLEESTVCTFSVSKHFFPKCRDSLAVQRLALHTPPLGQPGFGSLAVLGAGVGVTVCRWGMEVNPELSRIRARCAVAAAEQATQRKQDTMRRQLQRLQQRLQETNKLEERAKDAGIEALTEAEQAKLKRRGQVEVEIERLMRDLGLDVALDRDSEDSSESDELGKGQAAVSPIQIQKRREKEKAQKQHHEDKRALQKERKQNRDRKFID